MRICVWTLAIWMSRYKTRAYILDGTSEIQGFRFFYDELPHIEPGYAYIGHASEIFDDESCQNSVIIVHGHDMLIIFNQPFELVLNEVLAAGDYYNLWEASILDAMQMQDGAQRILELCVEAMQGFAGIADLEGTILATATPKVSRELEIAWKQTQKDGKISLELMSAPLLTPEGYVQNEWTDEPRLYKSVNGFSYIGCYLKADSEIVATLYIQEGERPLNPGDCNLAALVCDVLNKIISSRSSLNLRSSASILSDLIQGQHVSEANIGRLNGGDEPPTPMLTVVIRNIKSPANRVMKRRLLGMLNELSIPQRSLIYNDDVVVIVTQGELKAFLIDVNKVVVPDYYSIGISMPFSDWNELRSRYLQAVFALEWNSGTTGVFYAHDYAFQHLIARMQELGTELEQALVHPALDTLRQYDSTHGTDLYKTLLVYLANERNAVASASELFIHRNSLANRIKKIEELTMTGLEDGVERLYIMISYLLDNLDNLEYLKKH